MEIEITPTIRIAEDELSFRASRSSGPGGQNVNKVNTRIELLFDVNASQHLDDKQKRQICKKLATRIDKEGVLHIASQKHRSQKANREAAVDKFVKLIRQALRRKPVRKKTRVPKSAVEKRLQAKKEHSQLKKQRQSAKLIRPDQQ